MLDQEVELVPQHLADRTRSVTKICHSQRHGLLHFVCSDTNPDLSQILRIQMGLSCASSGQFDLVSNELAKELVG
jgi:hypothetical protein